MAGPQDNQFGVVSELQQDVLDNRARLITREKKLDAEVVRRLKRVREQWKKELEAATRTTGGLSATKVADLKRKASVLSRMGDISDTEIRALQRRINETIQSVYKSETIRHSEIINSAVTKAVDTSIGISFDGLHTGAMEAATKSAKVVGASLTKNFANLPSRVEAQMRKDVSDAIAKGWSVDELANKWAKQAGATAVAVNEARALARTSLMAASNGASLLEMQRNPNVIRVQWEATFDSRTCFVGSTRVLTMRGSVPIESIEVGDVVLTHRRRWRRVSEVFRRAFVGKLAIIRTGSRSLSATWDHPVLDCDVGWKPAASLRRGDRVVQLGESSPGHGFDFGHTVHGVFGGLQDAVLTGVAFGDAGLPVPICPVGLDHHSQRWDEEVNRSPGNLALLSKLDADGSEHLGDDFFEARSRLAGVIAVGTAVDAVCGWGLTNELPARGALDVHRGPVAHFGAIHPTAGMSPASGVECLATPFADHNDPGLVAALGAPIEPSGHRLVSRKNRPALSTSLPNNGVPSVAKPGAKLPARLEPATRRYGLATSHARASDCLGFGHDAIVCADVESVRLSDYDGLVYCLAVDEDETFFAEGVLVHNCPRCASLHGKQFDKMKPPPMPAHLNCVLPGNLVDTRSIVTASQSMYRGRVIEARTKGGRRITVTEKHPVLTGRGWVRAGDLRKDDDLVCEGIGQRVPGINPHHQHGVAPIEQVFRSLVKAGGVRSTAVPVAAEDLHGDGGGIQGDVHVVWADGFVPLVGNTASIKHRAQGSLDGAAVVERTVPETRLGTRDQILQRLRLAAYRVVGGLDEPGAVGGLGSLHACEHCGGPVAWNDAPVEQPGTDHVATDPEAHRDGLLALSGEVSLDQVVHIERYSFFDHVYDLQTASGTINCGGAIIHNCRCVWLPVTGNPAIDNQFERKAYTTKNNETRYRQQDRRFESWLNEQPTGTQRDFFPSEEKYQAWKKGHLGLDDMIAEDGSIKTDAELSRLKVKPPKPAPVPPPPVADPHPFVKPPPDVPAEIRFGGYREYTNDYSKAIRKESLSLAKELAPDVEVEKLARSLVPSRDGMFKVLEVEPSSVNVSTDLRVSDRRNGLQVRSSDDGGDSYAVRVMYRNKAGDLAVWNDGLELSPAVRSKGLGTKIFTDQVASLRKLGVKEMQTAAGRGGGMNGYYTWARFGYDAELSPAFIREVLPKATAELRSAKRVSDLMATPEGREFWKTHGESFHGTFDLRDNSYSMRTLNEYLRAKQEAEAAKVAPVSKPKPVRKPRVPRPPAPKPDSELVTVRQPPPITVPVPPEPILPPLEDGPTLRARVIALHRENQAIDQFLEKDWMGKVHEAGKLEDEYWERMAKVPTRSKLIAEHEAEAWALDPGLPVLRSKANDLLLKVDEGLAKLQEHRSAMDARIHEALKVPEAQREARMEFAMAKPNHGSTFTDAQLTEAKKSAKAAADWLNTLTGKSTAEPKYTGYGPQDLPFNYDHPKIGIEVRLQSPVLGSNDSFRAHARTTEGYVTMPVSGPHSSPSVYVHEFAHHYETRLGWTEQAAKWRNNRALVNEADLASGKVGKAIEPLTKLAPDGKYEPDEFAIPGSFYDPYVGKVYAPRTTGEGGKVISIDTNPTTQRNTEVISMGLEKLHRNPVAFATEDPEHFDLIIHLLRGLPIP